MALTPGVNAPLIRGGTPVCSYQCGDYRAILYKNPESFGQMKYPHVLVVFRAIDETPPIMFVTAEQNLMANELIASLPENLRQNVTANLSSKVFLGIFDETGHENYGHSEDYALLEKFETTALSLMKDRLGLTTSIEILNDTRRGDSFVRRKERSASPLKIYWDAIKTFFSQWSGASRSMRKSDKIVESLCGINPIFLHPTAYRAITRAVNERYQYYSQFEESPLNDEEVAMYKLLYLSRFAKEAGDHERHERFNKAILRLRKESGGRIRPEISLEAFSRIDL